HHRFLQRLPRSALLARARRSRKLKPRAGSMAAAVAAPKEPERDVTFPGGATYYAAADDVPGDKGRGLLRIKRGALVAIYKADDTNWWLGKVGDDVGWVPAAAVAQLDLNAAGRRQHVRGRSGEREWVQAEVPVAAADLDMDKTDFELTQAKTFDLHGSKITAYFVQVSCVRKGVEGSGRGDMWVVAKTLKAFNRLRVAWEEDYGANTVPVEPPPARWVDCSLQDWEKLRSSGLTAFLDEVKHRPSLRTSQDLRHFLTTDRVNLTGGMITERAMKPFLDAWVKTSSEPGWTQTLPAFPGEPRPRAQPPAAVPSLPPQPAGTGDVAAATSGTGAAPTGSLTAGPTPPGTPPPPGAPPAAAAATAATKATAASAAAGGDAKRGAGLSIKPPDNQANDDGVGRLSGTRPKMRRSVVFAQISALAAVTKQEASLSEFGRRGWLDSGLKLHLLTAGGQASGYKRKCERNVYSKYFKGGGGNEEDQILNQRGSFNAMKFDTRFNLEKIMYGRMEDMGKEPNAKYAEYARKKGLVANGGSAGVDAGQADPVKARGLPSPLTHKQRKQQNQTVRSGSMGGGPGHQKKNTMFVLDALAQRLERIQKMNDIQSADEAARQDSCQYMSRVKGRFSMPLPAQLMALDEMTPDEHDQLVAALAVNPAKGGKAAVATTVTGKLNRLRLIDTTLEDKRVRCHQVTSLLQAVSDPQERLLVVATCCARLSDAVEAEEQGLWTAVAPALGKDDLNLQRAKLVAQQLTTEALAEEASRKSRAAAREVHADVQRARKALNFLCKAVEKVRVGSIKSSKFAQLKERLEAAADAAREEARDAIMDAKPVKDLAEEALRHMQQAEKVNEDLDELGSAPYERQKAPPPPEGQLSEPEACLLVIQEALEVLLTMSENAAELASRAAENARFDMQNALDEVSKAEKMMRRVELEERRARNECDAAEGRTPEQEVGLTECV
ncbi:unnamed protein product, partial [Phaeothamnion confervicola]